MNTAERHSNGLTFLNVVLLVGLVTAGFIANAIVFSFVSPLCEENTFETLKFGLPSTTIDAWIYVFPILAHVVLTSSGVSKVAYRLQQPRLEEEMKVLCRVFCSVGDLIYSSHIVLILILVVKSCLIFAKTFYS